MAGQTLVLNGPPGVGKTTLAAELARRTPGAVHIRGDDLRAFAPTEASTYLGRGSTQRAAGALAACYLTLGAPLVIVDYCFLDALHVNRLLSSLPPSSPTTLVTLWASLEVVQARERARADDPASGRSPLEHRVAECWRTMACNRIHLGTFVETEGMGPAAVVTHVERLLALPRE